MTKKQLSSYKPVTKKVPKMTAQQAKDMYEQVGLKKKPAKKTK